MNNYTNIYDIDGNIIRKAGDNHRFTIEEVEKLVDDLTAKVQQNPDNQVYKVYLNNATKWLYNMYNNMSLDDLKKRISLIQDSIQTAKDNATELEQRNLDELNEEMDRFAEQYADQPYSAPVLEVRDEEKSVKTEENEGYKENIHTLHSGESETNEVGSPEGVQE